MASLTALVLMLALQPDPAMLRRLYEDNLARRQHEYGLNDRRTADAARDLGLYLREWATAPEARPSLARALDIDEKTLGAADQQTLADAANLASVSIPVEAEALWQRAAASSEAAIAALAFSELGELRESAGDRPGAAEFYRKALAKQELATGKTSARVAVRLNELALVCGPVEAIPLLERALAIDRRLWSEKHPETATTEVNLSGELLATGRVPEAIRTGTLALANFEATLGPDHPRTGAAASTLADALRAKGDKIAAERLYRRALEIDEKAYGPDHPETLGDVRNLSDFLHETGREREAAELKKRLNAAGAKPPL